MKTLFKSAIAVVGMVATACGLPDKGDPFRAGIPRAETVKLNLPSKGAALSSDGQRRDGLEGDTAELYKITRGVTVTVNGAAGAILTLVEKIVQNPPTRVTQNVAVWGPHTDPLSPNTFKFTVTQTAAQQFEYLLEAKGKTEADSAFRVVLSGAHVVTEDRHGSGTFLLDWNQVRTLPENDGNVGTANFNYSKTSPTADVTIDAIFQGVRDGDTNQRVDATYRYREVPANGGSLEFRANKNWIAGPGIEVLSVKSRWLQSGAGRSDLRGSGGEFPANATGSECWDSAFASRYVNASWQTSSTGKYGVETTCAFPTAQYAP